MTVASADIAEGEQLERIPTGIPELDLVLRGGVGKGRVHLVEGRPGTGKTTMATQFLVAGRDRGLRGLYVALSETAEELAASAASHGWHLKGIEVLELAPEQSRRGLDQSILEPSELDLGETIDQIVDAVAHTQATLVVIDSLAEVRLLATEPNRYRRQIMALRRQLLQSGATVLLLNDMTEGGDYDLQAMVHCVVSLQMTERSYGAARRRLRVVKMRGGDFQSGWHDFVIQRGQLIVFPSLIAQEHETEHPREVQSCGSAELDALFGGGLSRGSTTVLTGPSGVGKSTLAMQLLQAAARGGQRSAYFSFDEAQASAQERAEHLGFDFNALVASGAMHWERANPTRISPGEFVWKVRRQVEDNGASMVVIDSLNSYLETMPEEQALMLQLHELLTYLSHQGVVTLMVLAERGVVEPLESPIDLSFLSDAVVLMRYHEAGHDLRRTITVIKNRTGRHSSRAHAFTLARGGLHIGDAMQADLAATLPAC
ncbi:MAG: AAA family ATPase [Aquincola sp.]|nr:AAA family ATPase [Aquincola sp.]